MESQATQTAPIQSFAREGKIEAAELLREAAKRNNVRFEVLVAETALWANPDVHLRLMVNGSAAYFPNRRRYRAGQGETRGQRLGSLTLDDNSYANLAIKRAIGISPNNLVGFEAAHIWPRTCYDERYHTAIANLVLLPRAVAGLTDHSPEVQRALQYRAFVLYGWYPEGVSEPSQPDPYPSRWLDPLPVPDEFDRRTRPTKFRTLPTRFDVIVDGQAYLNLNKRAAMIRMVKALVAAGVAPGEIDSEARGVAPAGLFRGVAGLPNAREFLTAVYRQSEARGRRFDASRWFCEADELLQFGGCTYALTNQLGPWTANMIAQILEAFPDAGVVVRERQRG